MHTVFTAITFTDKDPETVRKEMLKEIGSIKENIADIAMHFGFDYLAKLDADENAVKVAEDVFNRAVESVKKTGIRPRDFTYSFIRKEHFHSPIAIIFDDGFVESVFPSWAEAMAYADVYMNLFSDDNKQKQLVPVPIYSWDCHF